MDHERRQTLIAAGGTLVAAAGLRYLARRRRRIDFRDRVVLVAGGSRGLGLVLARQFAAEGAQLVLLARTAEDLATARDELEGRGARVLAVPCDVRDRADVDAAVARTIAEFGRLDVLVHLAGVIQVGPVEHMTEADFQNALAVHFWGAYYLTEAALPHLPRDGAGRIAYVSSIGGRIGVPHLAPYAVSKFALVGYAEAMRAELAKDGLRVTTVTPGLMRTGSHVNAQVRGQHAKEYAWFAIADASPLLSTSAEHAARRILRACRYGDPALTITLPAKLGVAAEGLVPGLVAAATKLAGRLLPAATGPLGDRQHTGWESFSAAAPSILTRPADARVAPNNELRGHAPLTNGRASGDE